MPGVRKQKHQRGKKRRGRLDRINGMKEKKRTEWIVAHDGSKGADAYMLECLRCGRKQRFVVPIAVDIWIAASKAFQKMHGHCKEE